VKIGILKETEQGETRVALIPANVSALIRDKHDVFVESGAGLGAAHSDDEFAKAGAVILPTAQAVYDQSNAVFKVRPATPQEAGMMKEGSTYVGFLAPLSNAATIDAFCKRRITAFSVEYVPRITRAQSMDALSSMATVAGYKAVLLATEKLGKMFPLMMTAAGTVPAATALILGAGVAGLQAIATAKRLGAKVEAFDPRPAVKEQVKSLGATFIEMEITENLETAGGYAKEASEIFLQKEREAISTRLPRVHVLISTAQIFGKRAPVLITADMVKLMHPGAVIVDLAAEQGGNCELTEPGKTVVKHGVIIIGAVNLPATIPIDASLMYSKNLINLFKHLYPAPDASPDFTDEIVRGACITRNGEIVNETVRAGIQR
jgi:H+-translocating NAD(P) transhydrogenase subunit alpha